jgi:hypothetical protein
VGGQIVLNDVIQTAGANKGKSAGILTQAGLSYSSTALFTKRVCSFYYIFWHSYYRLSELVALLQFLQISLAHIK